MRTVAIPSAVHWLQPTLSCDRVLLKNTKRCFNPCVKHTEKKHKTVVMSATPYLTPQKPTSTLFVFCIITLLSRFSLHLMYPHHTHLFPDFQPLCVFLVEVVIDVNKKTVSLPFVAFVLNNSRIDNESVERKGKNY